MAVKYEAGPLEVKLVSLKSGESDSIRPTNDGIYITEEAAIQAAIADRAAEFPHLFAGPYNSLAEAEAARDALIPLTTHILRPEESES